ncbi:hypothetical protein POSPLADRAFT_1075417 [Postia placenta MAD-698-R-SB12]|uniref:Uncharacterized protein n=1 Tax=Postia placenta MAD-698-R-SB12 TaxID=670580 RepID=A0A1X6MUT1_9APHY|nr:hypothetical protein POSPLADRAFT_1075417 [Postia placenta MAD-698-R-SB12]OSX59986.1 hypothetical protein POSPLADRAFT_1075417 [Postia placenta MAD-698-R-SB12]
MGFTIMRDDPAALEQVRSMLTVKQKQKELIEQRRGSTASIVSTVPPSVNVVNAPQSSDDRQHAPRSAAPARAGGRSPNLQQAAADRRRSTAAGTSAAPQNHSGSSGTRHSSPNTLISAAQQPLPMPAASAENPTFVHTTSAPAPSHALPAPSISFGNRRRQLGGAKGKPADIVISPHGPQATHLQPAIQSAPPVPRADHGQGASGRYPGMAMPSLPQVGGAAPRYMTSRVPPTPTRLSMQRNAGPSHLSQASVSSIAGRSPPNPSIPIATSLVPPTPATLHHPHYTSEKSAFLAPFEMFYDALADSKQLKNWLGEQLQKSHALSASLQRQQEHLDEIVSAAVDRRTAAMREDIYSLHRRIEELEHGLQRATLGNQGYSPRAGAGAAKGKGKATNGASVAPEMYTFPPIEPHIRRPEPIRRIASPAELEARSFPNSQTASPVSFEIGRRMSVSAIRLDPRTPPVDASRKAYAHAARDLQGPGYHPPPGKDARSPKGGMAAARSHLHPSEDASARRGAGPRPSVSASTSAEGHLYREAKGSPASSDGKPEAARREAAYASPAGSRPRSPMDER